jgi:tryptophan synthase alpha chain
LASGRLGSAFAAQAGRTGLIPYLTAGYPSLDLSLELMRALAPCSLALEVGVPFSDPIADGPDIQRASEWALQRGVGVAEALELVRRFRTEHALPVVVMTYANPPLRIGMAEFANRAVDAGVDGVIVSDLPPDEDPDTWEALQHAGLDTVLLVAPTTDAERLALLLPRCRGFVYCLARTGVTGQGGGFAGSLEWRIGEIRARTALPVAVGFGIATAEQARALRGADAAIVGAAFAREIARDPERGVTERVATKARELATALES